MTKAIHISVIVLLLAGFGLFAYSLGYRASFHELKSPPTWPVDDQRRAHEQRWGPASGPALATRGTP